MKFKPFSEFLAIPPRNGLTKPKKVRGQGFKMVNMGELFKYSRMNNIPMDRVPLTDKEQQSSMLEAGDLLFARQSLVREGAGKCSIFLGDSEPVCFESHLIRCRLDRTAHNPLFYYYYFASPQGKVSMDTIIEQGAGAAGIRGSDLTKLMLPQYPLDYQNRVASVLDNVDSKIQLNQQINHTLEQMAQAIFKSWFVDFEPVKAKIAALEAGGTEEDALLAAMQAISGKDADQLAQMQAEQPEQYAELRATAELFPSAMQDSELGEIPEGWEVTTVADTAEIVKGKSYKSAELAESKTALVTLKSFNRGGGYRLDGLKEYTGKYKPKQEVMAGDLIIAYTDVTQAADVIGKPAMVIGDSRYDHLVISLDVAVVRPFEDALKPFLYGLAKTDGFQYHTRSHTTGTTVLHLAKNAVPGYEFALPLRPLIQAYTKQVNSLFSQIDQNVQQGRSLQALRDTLLPKLLSGELSIHQLMEDAEDE